jgi:steroid delta-isomerase-like uncharacterized protein
MEDEMSEENRALIHRWFEEVWTKGNSDAIEEMFDAEGIAHGLGKDGEPVRGPENFRAFHSQFRNAFPDIVITVEDCVCEGDKAVARCVVRGMHRGDDLGIAASNQPIEISGISIVRIRDGKIVEGWNNFDFLKLYQQIGAI